MRISKHKNSADSQSAYKLAHIGVGILLFPKVIAVAGILNMTILLAQAQIVGSPAQGPTISQLTSGTIQININSPNKTGLSHNVYEQFDVYKSGVIFNNSTTDINTKLGGQINGNAALSAGHAAKIILNEVNSSHPSHLGGLLEVAGPRTDVIVANPSGITCNGCGFINVNQATLTTGQPQIENGQLESFIVRQGKIDFQKAGLDARDTNKATILARAIEVNAKIFSKNLTIGTGQNRLLVSQITPPDNVETNYSSLPSVMYLNNQAKEKPSFALDVKEIGGMYAEHIYLVGTEAGLGVRHNGELQANKNLTINHLGILNNNNFIKAGGKLILNTRHFENGKEGEIVAQNIFLQTPNLINHGLIDGQDVTINTNQTIDDSKKYVVVEPSLTSEKYVFDIIADNQLSTIYPKQKVKNNSNLSVARLNQPFFTQQNIRATFLSHYNHPISLAKIGKLVMGSELDSSNLATDRTNTIDNFSGRITPKILKLAASGIDNTYGTIVARNQLTLDGEALIRVNLDLFTLNKLDVLLDQASSNDYFNINQKISSISNSFLDIPYQADTLVGSQNNTEKLIIDFRKLDCFTFLDYVQALQKSKFSSEFVDNLIQTRYFGGQISFLKRKHFITDWAYRNAKTANDITLKLSSEAISIEKNLNKKNNNELFLAGLPIVERQINYIPSNHVNNKVMGLLQSGDYVGIYSHHNGLDASHVGIYIANDLGSFLRHASSRKANQKVIDSPFTDYINTAPGIFVIRAKQ